MRISDDVEQSPSDQTVILTPNYTVAASLERERKPYEYAIPGRCRLPPAACDTAGCENHVCVHEKEPSHHLDFGPEMYRKIAERIAERMECRDGITFDDEWVEYGSILLRIYGTVYRYRSGRFRCFLCVRADRDMGCGETAHNFSNIELQGCLESAYP